MQPVRNVINKNKSIIHINKNNQEAALILVGLGNFRASWHVISKGFAAIGNMNIFLPDYIARESIETSAIKLNDFVRAHRLETYRILHIFAYILGGRILNRYLELYEIPNLTSIVYDRSPLQELAPVIMTDRYPFLSWLLFGKIIRELANTTYQPCPVDGVPIGLLIESKATPLMQHFKQDALAIHSLNWSPASFQQPYTDIMYAAINHDEMYRRFDVFLENVRQFFQSGNFGKDARRIPYKDNPFTK